MRLTPWRRRPAQRLIERIRLRLTAPQLLADFAPGFGWSGVFTVVCEDITEKKTTPPLCRPECGATVGVFVYIWKILPG